MLRTESATRGPRVLGPAELGEVTELLALDPVVNVFVDHRARLTRMEPRFLGGEMWGWYDGGELASVCHAGSNLVVGQSTPAALEAFAERAAARSSRSSTLVGLHEDVLALWEHLDGAWGEPRDARWQQPHLEIRTTPVVAPDPDVRRSVPGDLPWLYPACVAMYTEEVGVSPKADGGQAMYHARVRQLVDRGWSFARYDGEEVLFKAEVACVSPHACQVQGVWVHPDHRGRGLAVPAMAAVVDACLRDIAPVVSLYVNEHNRAARATYDRVGFEQTAMFSTLMF